MATYVCMRCGNRQSSGDQCETCLCPDLREDDD